MWPETLNRGQELRFLPLLERLGSYPKLEARRWKKKIGNIWI
jgi:hypothetical protein